jgi:hypothetical protein
MLNLTLKHEPKEFGQNPSIFYCAEVQIGDKPSDCIQIMHSGLMTCKKATALVMGSTNALETLKKVQEWRENQDLGNGKMNFPMSEVLQAIRQLTEL